MLKLAAVDFAGVNMFDVTIAVNNKTGWQGADVVAPHQIAAAAS